MTSSVFKVLSFTQAFICQIGRPPIFSEVQSNVIEGFKLNGSTLKERLDTLVYYNYVTRELSDTRSLYVYETTDRGIMLLDLLPDDWTRLLEFKKKLAVIF